MSMDESNGANRSRKRSRIPFHGGKHAMFLYRHLKFLPTAYQVEDQNRMSLAYFILSSLSLISSIHLSPTNNPEKSALDLLLLDKDDKKRQGYIDWVYEQQSGEFGGFVGSDSMNCCGESDQNQSSIQDSSSNRLPDINTTTSPKASTPSQPSPSSSTHSSISPPNLIQTYTALLILGILKDDFSRLNKQSLKTFVKNCQQPDGSFTQSPLPHPTFDDQDHLIASNLNKGDPRSTYSAFAICSILNGWSMINIEKGLDFLKGCQRSDSAFSSTSHNNEGSGLESQGGTTYCSIASYQLSNRLHQIKDPRNCLRWLVGRQVAVDLSEEEDDDEDEDGNDEDGEEDNEEEVNNEDEDRESRIAGFQGRPDKPPDACYSFWCTASIQLLKPLLISSTSLNGLNEGGELNGNGRKRVERPLYDVEGDRNWLLNCQNDTYGGIARDPDSLPDVYHTYLSLAALSIGQYSSSSSKENELGLFELDPAWNVSTKVKDWLIQKLHV